MSALIIAFMSYGVIIVALLMVMMISFLRFTKQNKTAKNDDVACEKAQEPSSEETKEEAEEQATASQEQDEEAAEEEAADEDEDGEESENQADETDEEQADAFNFGKDMKRYASVPFANKIANQPDNAKGYFDSVYNKLISYKKVHARVSKKGVSFRFGRALIAKMLIKGKTICLALALDVNEFQVSVYHQKDMSAKKAYAEIPFMVKLKSDRGEKHALALIDALAEKKGLVSNPRFTPVDAVKETIIELIKTK